MSNSLSLSGCGSVPLAHYLKALGLLRLVSEQADSNASGHWAKDAFVLRSDLDADGLRQFLLNDYRPTPVLGPWNNDGGLFATSRPAARETLAKMECAEAPRLSAYREAIAAVRRAIAACRLTEAPDKDQKLGLLSACRAYLPDGALGWMDAAIVLTGDGLKYPPLLGSGGNDGSLEFSKNFMQRLIELIDTQKGEPTPRSRSWLNQALFGEAGVGSFTKAPVGQFHPGAAGGPNFTSGFGSDSAVNPWDFVLMIEGALLFAAASVKKLESASAGGLAWPFAVRATGIGYGSAATADESDGNSRNEEIWMPLWSRPTTAGELGVLLSEGRAQVRGRAARTGVDFAEAAVTLGVDRGIDAFERYGFLVRNGLSTFATPLGRVAVRRNAKADLLAQVDVWLDRLRQRTGAQATPAAPASVSRALRQVETGILGLCKDGSPARVQAVLIALGRVECALARSLRWTTGEKVGLRPLAGLKAEWADAAETNVPEFRLARALASTVGGYEGKALWLRRHLEPVELIERHGARWLDNPSNDVAWQEGDLTNSLNAIFQRRLLHAARLRGGIPDFSMTPARLDDLAEFVEARTDDALLADLVWGLSLIDWSTASASTRGTRRRGAPAQLETRDSTSLSPLSEETMDDSIDPARLAPSSFYALLRLCYQPPGGATPAPPIDAQIHALAAVGRGADASRLAARRLLGSGEAPAIDEAPVSASVARRTAAALLFPIAPGDLWHLRQSVLRPKETHPL